TRHRHVVTRATALGTRPLPRPASIGARPDFCPGYVCLSKRENRMVLGLHDRRKSRVPPLPQLDSSGETAFSTKRINLGWKGKMSQHALIHIARARPDRCV